MFLWKKFYRVNCFKETESDLNTCTIDLHWKLIWQQFMILWCEFSQPFLEQEFISSEVLRFAWPQWGNYSSKVPVTSGLLSINNLFENLSRRTRKQHKPLKQNTCFYHERTSHRSAKTNCQHSQKLINPILNSFTASTSSH